MKKQQKEQNKRKQKLIHQYKSITTCNHEELIIFNVNVKFNKNHKVEASAFIMI